MVTIKEISSLGNWKYIYLVYTFTVTNPGQSPLSNIILTDPNINGGNTISGPVSGDDGDAILQQGEIWIYTALYPITANDINNGFS